MVTWDELENQILNLRKKLIENDEKLIEIERLHQETLRIQKELDEIIAKFDFPSASKQKTEEVK